MLQQTHKQEEHQPHKQTAVQREEAPPDQLTQSIARPLHALEQSAPENKGEDVNLEVLQKHQEHRTNVFTKPIHPFRLNETNVPQFHSNDWHQMFYRLMEEPSVLGWIAFQDDKVGASDRDYENSFLDVLRTYRKTVKKLQKEIGLSQILETSVVGAEGKVCFLCTVDDIWIALFVERDLDVAELVEHLFETVRVLRS